MLEVKESLRSVDLVSAKMNHIGRAPTGTPITMNIIGTTMVVVAGRIHLDYG